MRISAKLPIAILVATMAFSAIGCKGQLPDPPVKPGVELAAQNGGKISVDSFILTSPDFIDRDGVAQRTVKQQKNIAVLKLRISNPTDTDIKYKPLHFKDPAERIQICTDPNKETGERSNVSAIAFDKVKMIHTPKQHIEDQVVIPAGREITDEYLFEAPMDDSKQLVALVPGDILGDSSSKVFRFYLDTPKPVAPQAPASVNKPVTVDDLMVTVTRVEAEYAALDERNPKKALKYPYAYTKQPVLSIYVSLKNTGKKQIVYNPSHTAEISGINLSYQKNIALKRIKLNSDLVGKGQVKGKTVIEPGSSLTDVYFFEMPDNTGELTFELSGNIFGVNGLYKFGLNYVKPDNIRQADLTPWKTAKEAGEITGEEGGEEGADEGEEDAEAEGAEAADGAEDAEAPAEAKTE